MNETEDEGTVEVIVVLQSSLASRTGELPLQDCDLHSQ